MIKLISVRLKFSAIGLAVILLLLTGCDMNLRNQPKHEPFEASTFFADGRSARPLLPHTIARGHLRVDREFYTGQTETGDFVADWPQPLTPELLARGQERYDIFCTPCHGAVGNGQGIIVQRGMPQPPSFHEARLREAENGYFYAIMTNGFGKMSSYAARIPPEDRWAIVAYIRALELSQNATLADVPPDEVDNLESVKEVQE